MFSNGQLIFAAIFVLIFTIIIFFSYKKDKKTHSKSYKGIKWVGLTFAIFIVILFIIKQILKY
ncbi:cytochrome bd-type quinol oxidase subunit 1 [Saonia flava]|uniref:Cytochrome bd-type quinol oxidase subunit 1 n=1 Tax=Saonia flava TaxID=523696 RepID=A0A846R0M6_9FLAO|nr:cytochrome bd-type quinol oxidase subunit 1 [Saonia flava]